MQGFSAMVFALQLCCNTEREECNLAIFLYYYPYRGVELVWGKQMQQRRLATIIGYGITLLMLLVDNIFSFFLASFGSTRLSI